MKKPFIKKIPHKRLLHGDQYIDNYYWLRDDKRNNSNVIKCLQTENDYTKNIMSSQKDLNDLLLKEIVNRLPNDDYSVPYIKDIYLYQSRYENGLEYPKFYRRLVTEKENTWTLILDSNQRAMNSNFYSLGSLIISPNNCLIAISEDFVSRFQYSISFFNINNNYWYPEELNNTSENIEWDKDSKILFYIKNHPDTLRSYQVWCHELGTLQSEDKLIYEEKDDSYHLSICKTTSEKFILICIRNAISSEIKIIDIYCINKEPQLFLARRNYHKYSLDHYNDKFVICSNRDIENFNLYYTKKLQESHWKPLISANNNSILENFQLFRDWIVIKERKNGLLSLRQIGWNKKQNRENIINVSLDDSSYTVWLEYNSNPSGNKLHYGYSSMTIPNTIFEINLDTHDRRIIKKTIINNFNSNDYKSEYRFIKVRDGSKVPVSLVYNRKYYRLNENPVLVYGYGAYGNNIETEFSISRLSLLDRGFIYILAHIRGGGELGKKWHDYGKLFNKINTFTDFIDVTTSLVNSGIGNPNKLYAIGGSAGGLLIAAVINLAPRLFHGVIAQVPFVDVITTMSDKFMPLTVIEYDEWGNPEDINYYQYMKKYSPYDNIEAKDYPHIFVTAGLYDSQVQYWEPTKWVAKLRELKTDKNLLLLHIDMDSGHLGKLGRYKRYEDTAMEFTFLISLATKKLPCFNL
ncbi:oligopeptidase B [Candidatus Pantoea edessiphila]|uniref:Oligopeptidase B n=1 Tax=Candidatus Pantoea edessiphila TaxID=2044610 RepID=A0A2P5T2P1_9GAMM|nr:prolyl oligopeptidase family serine peptidase [Candidatus Pantoea edessiphila]PPI88849.1 oligopeptidase B [Candidatus Pantoea edessiphila]